jgi:hypothetical protein
MTEHIRAVETELARLAEDAARWNWLVTHAHLGFDGATSWNAVIRIPVFNSMAQTITALVDSGMDKTACSKS